MRYFIKSFKKCQFLQKRKIINKNGGFLDTLLKSVMSQPQQQIISNCYLNISFKNIMTQPQPQLLSLLEKAANPIQEVGIKITINGVYAPPQQWKITDQANPNIFGYAIKVLGQDFVGGKIQPRKLTQKQIKELEQKNKKGGKKEPKEQEKAPQVDPVEQERRLRQWNALSEQQKFYRTQEDPYKAFSLGLTQKLKEITLNPQKISELESQISNDSIQIILIRKPQMSEQDLQKLKKSKPKNLNLGELYPAVYKGTIKSKQLERPGSTKIVQRVKVSFSGNLPDDGVKIQTQNCYIYIEIQLSQPLTPQVKQIKPSTSQIIPEFVNKSQQASPILKLKQQICRSIRAISQQYLSCFSKEKQHTQQKRHTNPNNISTLRLNQINKRKQIFLNDFINSGKFNVLKQRISKSLKAVIIDKFRKQKQSASFSRQQINETLSQLNLYFQEQFTKTMDEFMAGDSTSIHEDLVLEYEHSRQARKNTIAPLSSETPIQRQTRLANQYQVLQKQNDQNSEYKAEKHYINILLLSNNSIQAKQNYAKFCLRSKKFNKAYILYSQIAEQSKQLQHLFIQAVLLVDRRRKQEVTQLLQKMMLDPQCQTASKINYNLLLSFMYERQNDIKNSQKYLAIAERYFKMKNNPHMKFTPVQNPYQLPKPKTPKPQRYISQLSHVQSQQIRLSFINFLSELNLYGLVGQYLPKLDQSNKKTILQIEADIFDNNFEQALTKIQAFLKKGDNIRNIDYLMIKADICYRADMMFECQQIFLHILQLKPNGQKILQVYLRLGYIYLGRKSWEDAKQVFEKAVEQKYNCSVAWHGLGISSLNLGKYDEAEQALNLSNIYNPLSEEVKKYQDQVNEHQRKKYEKLSLAEQD